MGIIRKQGFSNSIIYYAGLGVGYINAVLLYPTFFSTEEIGLINLLIGLSVLYAQFGSIGIPSIISRFFPFFKTADKTHNGFLIRVILFSAAGFIGFTLLFLLFRPLVFKYYVIKSALLTQYFNYIVLLALFILAFNVFESLARVIYHNVLSTFLREVVIKVLTCIAIILFARKLIDLEQFIIIYLSINALIAIILLIQLHLSRQFVISLKLSHVGISNKEFLRYGFYTLLTGTTFALLQKIDIIMLSNYQSLSIVGVYSTFFTIASVIAVPARALSRTSYQIVAESWKDNNTDHILKIYKTTSIVQLIIGSLLYIGILINQENLLAFIKNPEFSTHFNFFIILGLAFLVDITGGLNAHIIMSSHKYRVISVTVIACLITCILLNYFLIPLFGGAGAAWAFLLSMFIFNLINSVYIKIRFGMQPFNKRHLFVIVIAAGCYLIGKNIPFMWNTYADLFIRSIIATLIYLSFILGFRIEPELNKAIPVFIAQLKKLSGLKK